MSFPVFQGDLVASGRMVRAEALSSLRSELAAAISRCGVGPTSRIGIVSASPADCITAFAASRDLDAVPCLLSARETGATQDRVETGTRLLDCEPLVVIADEKHASALAEAIRESGAALLVVAGDGRVREANPATTKERHAHPAGTALICYTSGTEGPAKGVLLSARMVDHTIADSRTRWTPADRLFMSVPMTHLPGLTHTSAALLAGARVIVGDLAWLGVTFEALLEHKVSAANLVPYHLSALVRRPEFSSLDDLERVWLSAAPVVKGEVERAMQLLPRLRVANGYGLTEALRSSLLLPEDVPHKLPSIGRPVKGVEIELRDEDGRALTAPEARGIAWIRGPNVMTGYWRRPEDTAAVLQDGWFCSNDLLRRDAEGYLWLEGRRKELLNCGGEKISPEILEQILVASLPVREVAVIGVPQADTGMDEVVAVVVHDDDAATVTLESVRAACTGRVHRAFIPTRLVRLPGLPRKPEGKLDRNRLRKQLGLE